MITEINKTYPNGQLLTIHDDKVSPVDALKVTLTKVFTATDGEEYKQVILEVTENDLITEIDETTKQIKALQTKLDNLVSKKTTLRKELDKLPARTVDSIN